MRTERRQWLSEDEASRKLVIIGLLLEKAAHILEDVDAAPPEVQTEIGMALRYVMIAIEELPR